MMAKQLEMEERVVRLQEELRAVKEERYQAVRNLEGEEIKWKEHPEGENRMKALEAEAEMAKESERRMLESLACQTKQLEQTKILLEESKLEIVSLTKAIEDLEMSPARGGCVHGKSATTSVDPRGHEEMGALRTELRLAIDAEEKSKKAMDDLALVLKEVTTESNSVKEKLLRTKSKLHKTREERDRLKAALEKAEGKLRTATDDAKRLKLEAAAWNEKESGFLKCVKMCEEEISNMKTENSGLFESQRSAREEISKLREILKHAINEGTVVKEALEIARTDNSRMKDMLSEKESALQGMKYELECIKVSEAAALDSVKELQSLLVATSTLDLNRPSRLVEKESPPEEGPPPRRPMAKYPSEKWRGRDRPQLPKGRRLSLGDSDRFDGSILDMIGSPESSSSDQGHATVERKKLLEGAEITWESPSRQKKKRQILRRVGDLLMRKNSHKLV